MGKTFSFEGELSFERNEDDVVDMVIGGERVTEMVARAVSADTENIEDTDSSDPTFYGEVTLTVEFK